MKKIVKMFSVLLSFVIIFMFCACGNENTDLSQEPQDYIIQYSDETGVHRITVTKGMPYSIDAVPEKFGYEFLGLFDAEVGGTQYVSAIGASLSVFTDNKNLVLYPQFKAKEYTLIFDYQGAEITGARSITVSYGSEISDLPLNLSIENKTFEGWFTAPDKKGNQIADKYGVVPENRKITEKLYDLNDPDGNIKLYAGFKGEEYTVTFYFTDNGSPEEVKVEYGTRISDVQLETRVDGKAVISWSKKRNDTNKEQIFDGKVTGEMVLYAAEYAPVIDFNSNGGNSVNSIIARAGDRIKLPTPTRENYKFMGWQDTGGKSAEYSSMPNESVKLNAKWQAMIVFDTNGGTEVQNISEPQGTKITLPETEKAGFMFAGWYDESGEKYSESIMPSESVLLKARYRKNQKDTITIISASSEIDNWATAPNFNRVNHYNQVDLQEIYDKGVRQITVTAHYQSLYTFNTFAMGTQYTYMNWYSEKNASSGYLLWSYSDTHEVKNEYATYTQKKVITLKTPCIYVCYYTSDQDGHGKWKDFYIEIEYPDMSTLY